METAIIKIEESNEKRRANWEFAFKEMNAANDNTLLLDAVFEDENFEEWN
jgi:antitoxin MazE